MSTKRGVERGSRAIKLLSNHQPVSPGLLSHKRLKIAIMRLCARAEGQMCLDGASQVVGMSIIVGIRIFSIVGG